MFKIDYYEIINFKTLQENASLQQIYSELNSSEEKIIFVVDKEKKLKGTITDGDLRRFMEKNKGLSDILAKNVMNKTPKKIYLSEFKNISIAKLVGYHVNYLPVIDNKGEIVKVIYIPFNVQKKLQGYTKILIMAGGKGTRLYPLTKIIPKPLVPYKDKTIVENIMETFLNAGFNKFILSVNYKKELIKDYFKNLQYDISYIEEKTFLGTAGSIYYLKSHNIKYPFFVANCDVVLKENYYNILQYHNKQNADITIITTKKDISMAYGVVKSDIDENYINIEEKPSYSFYVNTGIYILNPGIINLIEAEEKIDMPELLSRAALNNKKIKVYKSDKEMIDIGQWKLYKKIL